MNKRTSQQNAISKYSARRFSRLECLIISSGFIADSCGARNNRCQSGNRQKLSYVAILTRFVERISNLFDYEILISVCVPQECLVAIVEKLIRSQVVARIAVLFRCGIAKGMKHPVYRSAVKRSCDIKRSLDVFCAS